MSESNEDKSLKYESLSIKEQMLGIKSSKSLPSDFYEKVLEYELSLKEKFDMKVLGTLIQYYSLAVEHFGSIGDDKKCQEYNENLNLLFKQMEVKKYMEEGKNIEHNVKKEELKKEMKSAEKKVNTNIVKNILKDKQLIRSGKSIVLKEIFNQAKNFKEKLQQKRKRFKSKLNLDNTDSSIISKKQRSNNNLIKLREDNNPINRLRISKSVKSKRTKIILDESTTYNTLHNSFKSELQTKSNYFSNNNNKIGNKSILNSNDFSIEKIRNELMESNDDTDDLVSGLELNFCDESIDSNKNLYSQSNKLLPIINRNGDITKLTEKKNFQKKIKTIITEYCQKYFEYYMNNTIDKIIKDYEIQSFHFSNELIDEEIEYYNQEKQLEFLRDDSDNYNDQIIKLLSNIKIEKEKKINELNQNYENNITKINNKYILNSNYNYSPQEIEIMKEKLKLDLTKEINDNILK